MVLVRRLLACPGAIRFTQTGAPGFGLLLATATPTARTAGRDFAPTSRGGQLSLAGVHPAQDRIPLQTASTASTTACAASYP
jgi:hypothetical protein